MPVAIAARRSDRLDSLAAEIRAMGGKAMPFSCDVTDAAMCERFLVQTIETFGDLYAVFANAGYGVECAVADTTDYDDRKIFETNFYGSMNLVRPALSYMLEHKRGHIMFCSSCLAKVGTPLYASYSASKAAQDHYARAMRIELAAKGIYVSSVHPIGTSTEFIEKVSEQSKDARLALRTPRMLMQPPERVANAIVKCLKKPRGEVWTSWTARTALGLGVIFPGIADRVLRRMVKM
jgi:short-subunit dehydrogenase